MLVTRNLPMIEAFGLLESSISRKGNGSCETGQPIDDWSTPHFHVNKSADELLSLLGQNIGE